MSKKDGLKCHCKSCEAVYRNREAMENTRTMTCANTKSCPNTRCYHHGKHKEKDEEYQTSCQKPCDVPLGIPGSTCIPYGEPKPVPLTQDVFNGLRPSIRYVNVNSCGEVLASPNHKSTVPRSFMILKQHHGKFERFTEIERKFTSDGHTQDEAVELYKQGKLQYRMSDGGGEVWKALVPIEGVFGKPTHEWVISKWFNESRADCMRKKPDEDLNGQCCFTCASWGVHGVVVGEPTMGECAEHNYVTSPFHMCGLYTKKEPVKESVSPQFQDLQWKQKVNEYMESHIRLSVAHNRLVRSVEELTGLVKDIHDGKDGE